MVATNQIRHGSINPQEATIPEDYSGEEAPDSPASIKEVRENGLTHATSTSDDSTSTPKERKKRTKKKKNKKKRQPSPSSSTGNSNSTSSHPPIAATTKKRRKKRNRTVHVASVDSQNDHHDNNTTEQQQQQQTLPPSIPIPMNQYNTVLIRRAVRKRTDTNINNNSPPVTPSRVKKRDEKQSPPSIIEDEEVGDDDGLEEYGDISLGMKLSVVAGKVIVQKLNQLSDGRASPAQMVGNVQRGDVLLSINYYSLVNLPIDRLMERLSPLSSPDASTGAYQRRLHLRLAAGEGMELLCKYEAAELRKASAVGGAATEVFSMFPMVDQLSGMPLFDPIMHQSLVSTNGQQQQQRKKQYQEEKKQTEEDPASPGRDARNNYDTRQSQQSTTQKMQTNPLLSATATTPDELTLDEIISGDVASWRAMDREKFTSQFFAWNDQYSELMRGPVPANLPNSTDGGDMTANTTNEDDQQTALSKSELVALGQRAMIGAASLSHIMERMDRGKDMRSFRSWNSSISLRSRASTRRQYVLDAVSLPVTMKSALTGGPRGGSLASDVSERSERSEMEDVDGDALLLRLAAHDEIWRNQVVEALKDARDQLLVDDDEDDSHEGSDEGGDSGAASDNGIDSAITQELGAFLFGETMAKIVTKKKKSKALPPDEITAVLFDLSTNLASTMPDEVDIGGGNAPGLLKSSLVPFTGRVNQEAGSSVILATRFVLDEALVAWLETFLPLPWESRRVLWPRVKSHSGDSRSPSMFSDGDSLTLDSGHLSPSTAYSTATSGTRKQTKDLQQQIEDQELDMEARAETCFLVTYYFTQRLLPKVAREEHHATPADGSKTSEEGELVAFVQKYGAYMKLHTCLAYAAALKRTDVIDELLELAEHDMRHREVIKLFGRRNALILYEPTMLSAIVKCLPLIRKETNNERRQVLVDICVSAYPDLCPWQVKQALLERQGESDCGGSIKESHPDLSDLYYYYLSSLLHPHDGHEAARDDAALVEEWCILSLAVNTKSKTASASTSTRRDNFLCIASRSSSDHLGYHRDLAMLVKLSMASHEYDLALELAGEIADSRTQHASVAPMLLPYLNKISRYALDQHGEDKQLAALSTLKRVIRLLHDLSVACPTGNEHSIYVPGEFFAMLEYKETGKSSKSEVFDLTHFLAKEAPPSDFLQAFSMWTATHNAIPDTVHILQSVLMRGAKRALHTELSGSLLRLRRARKQMNRSYEQLNTTEEDHEDVQEQTIWSRMAKGLVAIDK